MGSNPTFSTNSLKPSSTNTDQNQIGSCPCKNIDMI